MEVLSGYSEHDFHRQVLRKVGRLTEVDTEGFRAITRLSGGVELSNGGRPRAVYTSTALQIGLLANSNVPDLIASLVLSHLR